MPAPVLLLLLTPAGDGLGCPCADTPRHASASLVLAVPAPVSASQAMQWPIHASVSPADDLAGCPRQRQSRAGSANASVSLAGDIAPASVSVCRRCKGLPTRRASVPQAIWWAAHVQTHHASVSARYPRQRQSRAVSVWLSLQAMQWAAHASVSPAGDLLPTPGSSLAGAAAVGHGTPSA
jgi:hypothetical protein